MKRIVIAGGGFAGVRLARQLRKQKDIRVTLINDSDVFRYSPALYRAATGFKIGTARLPLEWMLLDSSNTELIKGKVTRLDEKNKQLILEGGLEIQYDQVVFALGAVTTYFKIDGLDKYSFGVKTFEEILKLKHHIHDGLLAKPREDENYVIVGAGPTGVELAGALGSFLERISKKHKIHKTNINVYLVEAGPRILPQLSEKAARKVMKRLKKLNIRVLTNTNVKSATLENLKTSTGTIKTHNVIWTAGTTNNPFFKKYPKIFNLDHRGKVKVNRHLQVSGSIYVCGDNASTKYSGLAVEAIRHANYVSKDIKARLKRDVRPKLRDKAPFQIVPAGSQWAVFQYRKLVLYGKIMSIVRKIADIIGYTEVLGPLKALTIWSNSHRTEDHCTICKIR